MSSSRDRDGPGSAPPPTKSGQNESTASDQQTERLQADSVSHTSGGNGQQREQAPKLDNGIADMSSLKSQPPSAMSGISVAPLPASIPPPEDPTTESSDEEDEDDVDGDEDDDDDGEDEQQEQDNSHIPVGTERPDKAARVDRYRKMAPFAKTYSLPDSVSHSIMGKGVPQARGGADHFGFDSLSAILVVGNKMIVGTENGRILVFALASFAYPLEYAYHNEAITSISASPVPAPDEIKFGTETDETSRPGPSAAGSQSDWAAVQIVVAYQSGKMLMFKLSDQKAVSSWQHPCSVRAVAMAPVVDSRVSFVVGDSQGFLTLYCKDASGWRGLKRRSGNLTPVVIGNAADDPTLTGPGQGDRTPPGKVMVVRWSPSGRFICWATEGQIRFVRTGIRLPAGGGNYPASSRAENYQLESVNRVPGDPTDVDGAQWMPCVDWVVAPFADGADVDSETVLVGWKNTVWRIVLSDRPHEDPQQPGRFVFGAVKTTHFLNLGKSNILGVTMLDKYSIAVLSRHEDKEQVRDGGKPVWKTPEMRLIEIGSEPSQETDGFEVEIPNASIYGLFDFHMPTLYLSQAQTVDVPRTIMKFVGTGFPGMFGAYQTPGKGALEAISHTLWDVTPKPGKIFNTGATIFNSGATILNSGATILNSGAGILSQAGQIIGAGTSAAVSFGTRSADSSVRSGPATSRDTDSVNGSGDKIVQVDPAILASTRAFVRPGLKMFVCTRQDVLLATTPDDIDVIDHFIQHRHFRICWKLLEELPDLMVPVHILKPLCRPIKPSGVQPQDQIEHEDPVQLALNSYPDGANSELTEVNVSVVQLAIGHRWIAGLVSRGNWERAGRVARMVLRTRDGWERWTDRFVAAGKFDELVEHLPSGQAGEGGDGADTIGLPAKLYTPFVVHYSDTDIRKMDRLVRRWGGPERLEPDPVVGSLEASLRNGRFEDWSDEWRIALNTLAPLFLAQGRPQNAVHCYLQLQDINRTFGLVNEQQLLPAVVDDLVSFLLLRLPPTETETATREEIEAAADEAICMLVDQGLQGTIDPAWVVRNLTGPSHQSWLSPLMPRSAGLAGPERSTSLPIAARAASLDVRKTLLFLYLRRLWSGNITVGKAGTVGLDRQLVDQGRLLVDQFADVAVDIFAHYDRALLLDFFKSSTRLNVKLACEVCRRLGLVTEHVFVLSKAGKSLDALRLLIGQLHDVTAAILFAKERRSPALWNALLEYTVKEPRLIPRLLTEIGSAIDPVHLIDQIPLGVKIEGLRDGITSLMREFEIQQIVADGAAKVMRGEVSVAFDRWTGCGRGGIRFPVKTLSQQRAITRQAHQQLEPHAATSGLADGPAVSSAVVAPPGASSSTAKSTTGHSVDSAAAPTPGSGTVSSARRGVFAHDSTLSAHPSGYCVECGGLLTLESQQSLINFKCGHVHHLTCILDRLAGRSHDPHEFGDPIGGGDSTVTLTNANIHRTAATLAVAMTSASRLGVDAIESDELNQSPIMVANRVKAVGSVTAVGSTSPIQSPIILPFDHVVDPDDYAITRASEISAEIDQSRKQMAVAAAAVLAASSAGRSKRRNVRRAAIMQSTYHSQASGMGVSGNSRAVRGVAIDPSSGIGGRDMFFEDVPLIPTSSANKIQWAKSLKRTVMSAGCAVCVQAVQQ